MKRIYLSLCAILVFTNAYQQSSISMAQSMLIFEISGMIEWPENQSIGPFIIGIVGESDIEDELEAYTSDKTIASRDIKIVRFTSPKEVTGCHVLFIPFSQTRMINEITNHIGTSSTLLITERSGALKSGAAVNFILTDEKMKFEISPENAGRYGLRINPRLRELALREV